jgi:alpha-L-fucosidase
MNLKFKIAIVLLLTSFSSFAQNAITSETAAQKEKRLEWWQDARFGMFIHWGLYSMPARHEWVRSKEKITNEAYQVYFENFNPVDFNPVKWAREAKAAGMKYAVLTTKHHEGFCLFDSKFTDYKATNTLAKRDLVREYVNAFRAEGIKIGFYYSLIDWHHSQFPIDKFHPLRPADNAPDSVWNKLNKNRDMAIYRKYLYNQVTELLSNYGKIDVLWLDFSYPEKHGKGKDDWNSVALLKQVRKLQPGIIIDNRTDLKDYKGAEDFETPEQVDPKELFKYRGKVWETCQTFSGSWGYYRDEKSWKTPLQLLDLLITSVANGGNLILNVGPTARGEFDYRANNALDSIGYWMHANSKSIYNCTYAPKEFIAPNDTRLTYNKQIGRLYVHLLKYSGGKIKLTGFKNKVKYAQFLHDNSELQIEKEDKHNNDLVLNLPKDQPPYVVPVIELFLK